MLGTASHFTTAASITMAARCCGPVNNHSLGETFATGVDRVACESTGSKIPQRPHMHTVLSAWISPGSFRVTRPTSGAFRVPTAQVARTAAQSTADVMSSQRILGDRR
jgi:hypothetical protein